MKEIISKTIHPFYDSGSELLLAGDCFELLKKIKSESADIIFADPPYFLSNDGVTCQNGKMVSVNKGKWDKGIDVKEKHEFNRKWLRLCKRVLKPNGTIWISGTLHNIYSIGMALEQEGYKILNNITWQKTNPPPNLACRCFTHSTETILWAKKAGKQVRHYFNYEAMKEQNDGKQMKDVWSGSLTKASEKTEGKHPTQKPEYLLERIILASTKEGDLVLDPFCGSGTTGVAAKKNRRRFLGMEQELEYLELTKRRLIKLNETEVFEGRNQPGF